MILYHIVGNPLQSFRQGYASCWRTWRHASRETEAKARRCVLYAMLLEEAKSESAVARRLALSYVAVNAINVLSAYSPLI